MPIYWACEHQCFFFFSDDTSNIWLDRNSKTKWLKSQALWSGSLGPNLSKKTCLEILRFAILNPIIQWMIFQSCFFFPSPDWPTHAADAECMGWGGQGGRFGSVSHGNDEQKRDIVGKNHVFSIFKVTQKRIQNFSGSWTYCSIIFLAGTTVPNWGRGTEFMDIWDASTGKLMMKHWISGVTHPWTGRDGDFTWTVWSAEGGQSSSLMMQVLRLNGWKLILNGTVHSCLMRAYNQISKGWSGVKVRVPHAQEAQLLKQFWAMYG